jgi:hypothetical protein
VFIMNRRIARTGLVLVTLLIPCLGTGAFAGIAPEGFKDAIVSPDQGQHPVERPFKLKGGGQIDLDTFSFNFGGTATHLGLYSSTGAIDPSTFLIQGTMTAANGDTLDWAAQFAQGPLGEIEATFTVTGGTGRFNGATGSASGPVALDPDFSFTLKLEGTITY